jgi:hypothetical protein
MVTRRLATRVGNGRFKKRKVEDQCNKNTLRYEIEEAKARI